MRKADKNSKLTHYKRRTKIRKGLYRYNGVFGEIEVEKKSNGWNWISSGTDNEGNFFTFKGVSESKKQAKIDAQNHTEKKLHGNKLEDLYESL